MRMGDRRLFPTCAEPGCNRPCPVGRRKCGKHIKTNRMKVTQGREVRRGRNKIGIAAHKPDRAHTRRAKRQNTGVMGAKPNDLTAYRYDAGRA